MRWLRTVAGVVSDLRRAAEANRLSGLAAEVTFYVVLSLFPGLLILACTLGYLDALLGHDIAEQSRLAVVGFLAQVLTEQAEMVIESVNDLFRQESGGLMTAAVLFSFYTMSDGFAAAIRALDRAYGVKEKRSWLNIRLTSFVLALGSAFMLAATLITIVVGPFLGTGERVAVRMGMGGVFSFAWDWLRLPVSLALLTFWATTLYHLAPHRRTAWLRDLPGGVMAALLWVGASHGFSLYLSLAGQLNQVLSLLGGGLILLLWLYLMAYVLLAGGQLNSVLAARRALPAAPSGSPG